MQTAFKQGLITYHRSNDRAVSEESISCMQETAKIFGINLKPSVLRPLNETNTHQAPSITLKGIEVLKSHKKQKSNDPIFYILRKMALLQLRAGIPKQVKRIKTEAINKLPKELDWIKSSELNWQREQYDNNYMNTISGLFDDYKLSAFIPYNQDKSIIKTMQRAKLGTPATQVDNTQRFIKLKLYDPKKASLTSKGENFIYKVEGLHNSASVGVSDDLIDGHQKMQKPDNNQDDEPVIKSIDTIIGSNNRKKQMRM